MKQTICILFLLLTSALHGQQTPVKTRVDIVSTPKRVEFSPTISADGRTMIYESQNGDKWELYQSILRDGNKWSTPVALTAINDKCDFIGGPSLSYDGNTLYYTAFIKGVTKNEDIYYSTRLGDERWSEPKSIGRPVNTDEEYEGFPSVSADGQSLYFIRQNKDYEFDRKSKEACFKIWMSRKLADGTWGEPQVLPEPVNTGCERDPRIMADNHTLIFSSIREEGMGKYDLFQSRLSANGTWDEPVPLDFVNSGENDQSPCISASGDHMYYYSDKDIYKITIPREYRQLINVTLLGKVTAGPESTPVKSVIVVQNVKEGNSYFTQSNPNDGRYSIVMSAGQTYTVTFSAAGFRPAKLTFDYSNETTYREEAKDVNLSSLWPVKLVIRDKDMPA
ncbi:MAG TPA: carboxypeptidase-like regulatory domain-containing protein, partial [Chryseosolibacter sp.]|nr:carboxypeptidase-like regulatory domain-containing protein [Chryseosolibacter sp.]